MDIPVYILTDFFKNFNTILSIITVKTIKIYKNI